MTFTLYLRDGCHLCEQALALLHAEGLADGLELVDIDDDPELGVDYGLRVPVLRFADGRELDWPFTTEQLRGAH
ncbi:MAG: glutaredoxin family protein [Xanthomonadales bacterium]|nr:hypothetical protein [Xanthomonadales bacterium]MCC6592688.1 glutaredoxin family protein [Xanthomonadales bacterium]MCE7930813.1 glutaredoxin family protein [Xanthomonadales bacterium PRO6]